MSITLEFPEDEAAKLRQTADRVGIDVEAFVRLAVLEAMRRRDPIANAAFLQAEGADSVQTAQAHLTGRGIGYVTGDEERTVVHEA